MRLVGIFILAMIVSALAGGGAIAAVSLLPDWDDAAGRGLDDAFRALLTVAYVILSFILYGFAIWRRDRDRHLKRALYILLLVPLLIAILGIAANGVRRIDWIREIVGMVQMFAPLWVIALVQWAILHFYLSRRIPRPESAPA
jgi:cell division protein FtsW (lipid II flippase)